MNHEKVAEIVEKSAALIDALEADNASLRAELASIKQAEVTAEADKLAAAIEAVTGDEVDREVVAKIAASGDDDVKQILRKLSFTQEVPSMGSVSEDDDLTKTAADLPPEDQRLLNWIQGG